MVKPLQAGERVTWTKRDHGKDKKVRGIFRNSTGSTAYVDVDGECVPVQLAHLSRCRGKKPASI